ncbi:MAG: hypothetical protein ACRDE2_00080 [Chitinophagaceae bacterium]
MNKKLNFTKISAILLNGHKPEIINLLRSNGVLISNDATNSQIINAYLISIAASPTFRKDLTNFVYSEKNRSVDGLTYGATLSPNYGLNLTNSQLNLPAYSPVNDPLSNQLGLNTNIPSITPSTTGSSSGLLSKITNVLSSPAFNTILTTVGTQMNGNLALKEQTNQIQAQQLQYANNQQLLNAGINPTGTAATGLSSGAKIGIFLGVIVVVGGIIFAVAHKKGSQTGQIKTVKAIPMREQKLLR